MAFLKITLKNIDKFFPTPCPYYVHSSWWSLIIKQWHTCQVLSTRTATTPTMLATKVLRKYVQLCKTQARSSSGGENSISSFLATKTVQRQNGEKEKKLFTDQEYQRRLASLRLTSNFFFNDNILLLSGRLWRKRTSLPASSPLCTIQLTSLTLSIALLGGHMVL